MSTTPTPSVSSGQSFYHDAVVMQFPRPDDAAEGCGPEDPRNGIAQPPHTGEMASPLKRVDDEIGQKTPSLRSLPTEDLDDGQEKQTSGIKRISGGTGSGLGRKASVRTTTSTRTTTSAFANGAPLAGNAEPDVDQSLPVRSANAEQSLSQKQKDRIAKEERKESMRFSKLLKTESTTERVALDSALRSLSSLQSLHKAAIKREAKAGAAYSRALSAAQGAESRFHEENARANELRARVEARCMEERARWKGKEGQVRAEQERLDSERGIVKEMEMRIAECAREVERLRIVKATDEREREAKLTKLAGQM